MNAPEKIAQTYLRFNGFFTIPHFTTLKEESGHIDFLAVRLAGSQEKVGIASNRIPLNIDDDLLSNLDISKDETLGLIIEVKGTKNKSATINESQYVYAKSFFGSLNKIKTVGFENRLRREIYKRGEQIIIPLKYCITFIKQRFSELKSIEENLRGNGILSKEGSWELSEEFLSDLLYLEKLKVLIDYNRQENERQQNSR